MLKINLKKAKNYQFVMEITVPCVLVKELNKPKNEQETHTKTIKSALFKEQKENKFIFHFHHKENGYQFEMNENEVKNYVRVN